MMNSVSKAVPPLKGKTIIVPGEGSKFIVKP